MSASVLELEVGGDESPVELEGDGEEGRQQRLTVTPLLTFLLLLRGVWCAPTVLVQYHPMGGVTKRLRCIG